MKIISSFLIKSKVVNLISLHLIGTTYQMPLRTWSSNYS